jgi:hypothetical protein
MSGIGWKAVIGIGGNRQGRHGSPQQRRAAAKFMAPLPGAQKPVERDLDPDRQTPRLSRDGHPAPRGRRP